VANQLNSSPLPTSSPLSNRFLAWVLPWGIYAIALFAAIATFIGFLGSLWWGFELLDHPRPQYCLLLLPAIALTLLQFYKTRKMPALIWLWTIPLLINLVLFLPLYLPAQGAPATASATSAATSAATSGETLQIVHANLDRDNAQPHRAVQFLDDQEADLIFVQEVTPEWLLKLQTDLKNYQLFTAEPRDNTQGSALFLPLNASSKDIKILDSKIINLPDRSERPLLQTTIYWAGKEITLLSLHVIRPRSTDTSNYQKLEFDAVADWALKQQQQSREVVVIGDFNSTPWSARFRQLLNQSKLLNSQRGFGLQPTWNAVFPAPLRIAIDHCLHSAGLQTTYRNVGRAIGSDHLPVIVQLEKK
jgi:endonuclease/exonuclease/phosphatase (EEP) superfamily protein YafD